jgi:hypothetical protein
VLAALAALVALMPGRAFADPPVGSSMPAGLAGNYAPPAIQLPYPLYTTHPEAGGLFVAGSYVMYQQSNPLRNQEIAVRGFIASDDTVLNAAGSAGTFVGSRNNALDVGQLTGPSTFQPGFQIDVGWKFADGSALTFTFWWISESQFNAAATLAQPIGNGLIRSDQADTFLTAPVFNFPSDFAGAPFKVQNPGGTAGPFSVYGIWNGASIMTEVFLQRAWQYQATYRKPFYETENYRASALVGPRIFILNELFRWTTTDLDNFGQSSPIFVGIYNNQVNNNMYGVFAMLQQEWYVGRGWALMLNAGGAGLADFVKERASYSRGYRADVENKRSKNQFRAVPEVQVTPSVMWYPLEGIQLSVGWDFFAFFNTVGATTPVDFNYGSLTPGYSNVFRYFQGFNASIAFVF